MLVDDARYLFFTLNIWLCVSSTLMVGISAIAVSISLTDVGLGVLLPPLLFYFIYVEDRRTVSSEDEINQPHRTALVRRYPRFLLGTELAALVGYEGLVSWFVVVHPQFGGGVFLAGQLPIAVLVLYDHLKRHPTFDSVAVGATWAFVTVFALMLSTGRTDATAFGGVFIGWFVLTFAGVESRNIADADGDLQADKATLAGTLGRRWATIVVIALKLSSVLLFWAISGVVVACLVLGYVLLLRLCRRMTHREAVALGRSVQADTHQYGGDTVD